MVAWAPQDLSASVANCLTIPGIFTLLLQVKSILIVSPDSNVCRCWTSILQPIAESAIRKVIDAHMDNAPPRVFIPHSSMSDDGLQLHSIFIISDTDNGDPHDTR